MSSKAAKRRRAYEERCEKRARAERLKTYPWFCRHGDAWPAESPVGLCGCTRPGATT